MKKKIFALICALMLIALPALAVPSPSEDFYVLDQANVRSSETEWRIIYNNDLLYDACGAQIVFVTVDDTDGEAIDDYAYDLFNRWGIGSSDRDNGFLVLMAIDDDNYYAIPGTGLEKRLSSGEIKLMLDDDLEPDFAARDYDAGARTLFDALYARISDEYSAGLRAVTPPARSTASTRSQARTGGRESRSPGFFSQLVRSIGGIFIALIVLAIVIVLVAGSRFTYRRRRRRSIFAPPPPPGPRPRGMFFGGFGGPRPGSSPRPRRQTPPPHHFGGGGRSGGGGAGRGFGGFGGGHSGGFGGFGGGRSGGGGGSRGGGAGRGR